MSKLSFLDNGARAKYPRVVKRIELSDYHKKLKGDYVEVWLNLPQRLSEERLRLMRESFAISKLELGKDRDERMPKLIEDLRIFHAEWWDVPVDQLNQIYAVDTTLYTWILNQASAARKDYEEERKNVESGS